MLEYRLGSATILDRNAGVSIFRIAQLFVAAGLILLPHATLAEDEPLFELNLVGGVGTVPDYPASDQHHIRAIALPFATYRGTSVRANYEGIQADVVKRPQLGADASIGFSLPSSSDSNVARRGMPDIDTLLEIGPRLYVLIPTGSTKEFRLIFPIRAVIATDLQRWTDRGLLFAPGFIYKIPLQENHKSNLIFNLGINFGTNRLNQYFYEVLPEFAQADRPVYRSRAGYIGSRASAIYTISSRRFRYFAAAGVQSYKGSANAVSPLHRKDYDATLFGGVIWSFYHSDAKSKTLTQEL